MDRAAGSCAGGHGVMGGGLRLVAGGMMTLLRLLLWRRRANGAGAWGWNWGVARGRFLFGAIVMLLRFFASSVESLPGLRCRRA